MANLAIDRVILLLGPASASKARSLLLCHEAHEAHKTRTQAEFRDCVRGAGEMRSGGDRGAPKIE
jgi:hypothetical protein